jgi:hypothetical protein
MVTSTSTQRSAAPLPEATFSTATFNTYLQVSALELLLQLLAALLALSMQLAAAV